MNQKLILVFACSLACLAAVSVSAKSELGGEGAQGAAPAPKRAWHADDAWRAHWHAGDAEIARYELSMSRYGEARKGEVVLVFVTEDMHPKTLVKHEAGKSDEVGAVPVLKLNRLQRFSTGVYDYSMMLSVFTPEDLRVNPRSLKLSASSQEWCGHVWLQARLRGDRYAYEGHSYFEREGDERFEARGDVLEDELFNRIRIDPKSLPVGEIAAIPGAFDSRLRHYRPTAVKAVGKLIAGAKDAPARYELRYATGRTLEIDFEKRFPFGILAWTESFDRGGQRQRIVAKRTHVRRLAYWSRNRSADAGLREELGLTGRRK